jgi:hypothetical protein
MQEAMGATVRKPLFGRLTPPVSLAIGARSSPSCLDRRIRLTVLRHPVWATLHQVASLVEHGKADPALLGAAEAAIPVQPETFGEKPASALETPRHLSRRRYGFPAPAGMTVPDRPSRLRISLRRPAVAFSNVIAGLVPVIPMD